MDLIEFILLFIYSFLILAFAFFYNRTQLKNYLYQKYFMSGLIAKMVGGIGYASLYTFYYDYGGDTGAYFNQCSMIFEYFFHDFEMAFDYLYGSDTNTEHHSFVKGKELYLKGSNEFFAIKIMSVVNMLALNHFFTVTLLFSVFSYVGIWHLFLILAKKYPHLQKQMAISILFIPSVFFWGSGLMKDTIVIGFVGLIIYFFYQAVETKKSRFKSILIVIFSSWLIFNIKEYVIISLAPALLIWVMFNIRNKITSKFFKAILLPLVMVTIFVGAFFTIQVFGQYSTKYSAEQILTTAKGMQSWHQVQHHRINGHVGRGSSYTLGEYDESVFGIVKMVPASINVTLFRPYPTEITSAIMIFSALESLIILIFSIYVFIGLGFFRILKILNSDAFLLMALLFALFFAFAVGFTSYNFGALVRYKIPCIPFYLCSLFILQHEARRLKGKITTNAYEFSS